MDLHKSMTLFIEVARMGSLAGAGRKIGLSPPSATRLLNDLEDWLGQPLVRRSTRHLSLTELGARYLPRCIEIVENTEALKSDAARCSERPTGRLRVTAAGIYARRVVSAVIPDFLAQHPSVWVQLDATNRIVDLMAAKMDLAIRVGKLEDSRLVARRIGDTRTVLVASPAFVSRRGQPKHPGDLSDLPCLVDTVPHYGARWPFLDGKIVKGPAMINDGEIIRDLAVAGMGVAYLPDLLVRDDLRDGRLIELLPEIAARTSGIYAVFPPHDYISAAARAFADATEAAFA